jgi:hypothetical protein
MAYLRLYNPTTDSCDFKVRLSNSFNTRYYKRLRITKTNYGDSTSSVGSYLEDRTASSSSSASEYVRGVVNEGLHEGRTYTLYAYAQARNSTWYLAGSDDITMEDDGSKEYDYEIESIKSDKSEPFKFGDGVEFEVEVYNCKRSRGPKYKVLLKDRRGNTIAYDDEPYLDGKETNSAYLATTIKKSDVVDGKAKFTFVVESRESGYEEVWPKDNTKVVEYEVRDNTPMGNLEDDTTLNISSSTRETLVAMGQILLDKGFKVGFVAGMLGNIVHEAKVGQFENSTYTSNPSAKPDYLEYMDNNYNYNQVYSNKNIMDIGIAKTKIISDASTNESANLRKGFGLGCIQWTFSRNKTLFKLYEEECDSNGFPTKQQCCKVEGNMICTELLTSPAYKSIYKDWLSNYEGTDNEAYEAGKMLCLRYERPKGKEEKAPKRADSAKNIYNVMMGN